MRVFELTIPGTPVPKGRPRVYRNGGMHGVTPARTLQAEQAIREAWQDAYPGMPPMEGPVGILMEFWMPDRHIRDYDNLAKLVTDALNRVAYLDDGQINQAVIIKHLPDRTVRGARGMRRRHTGDPLACDGQQYEPHTYIRINNTQGKKEQNDHDHHRQARPGRALARR